eukprot:1604678-Rhodomonas_salina.4
MVGEAVAAAASSSRSGIPGANCTESLAPSDSAGVDRLLLHRVRAPLPLRPPSDVVQGLGLGRHHTLRPAVRPAAP